MWTLKKNEGNTS